MNMAKAIDAIVIVQTTTERNVLFPTPATDQRVYNKETAVVERWDGTQWIVHLGGYPLLLSEVGVTRPQYPYGDARRHGADTTGAVSAVSAITNCFATCKALKINPILPGGCTFRIDSTVSQDVAPDTKIFADGALFTCTSDSVAFDLNPGAVWDTTDNTTIRHLTWSGGFFTNTAGSKTASIGIKAHHMRAFRLVGARFQDFFKSVSICGKDTYLISDCTFRNAAGGYDIYHPTDAESGITSGLDLPLMIILRGNYHSGFPVSHIYIGTRVSTFVARDCSFNGAATGPKVYLRDSAILFGEGYTFDSNHWETSIAGQYNILFDDANGQGFYGIELRNQHVGGGAIGWKGAKFQRCRGVKIGTNVFRDGTGGATEVGVEFDANCVDFSIDTAAAFTGPFATPVLIDPAVPRNRYTIYPEYRTPAQGVTGFLVTGYSGTFSSVTNETIDMSVALGANYPTFGTPKGYLMYATIRDSGSLAAAANTIFMKLRATGAGASFGDFEICGAGAPNNEDRIGSTFVPCDANGDINMDRGASGAGLLTLRLYVKAIIM